MTIQSKTNYAFVCKPNLCSLVLYYTIAVLPNSIIIAVLCIMFINDHWQVFIFYMQPTTSIIIIIIKIQELNWLNMIK